MTTRERWIVVAATVAVILVRAAFLALAPPRNPLLTDHDIPHYATIAVAADEGVSFARDPIFAGRAALVWRAASGYMAAFRALHLLAGRDFGLTLALLQLLLLAVYVPSMTAFLRAIGASLPVALAVALISTVESSFLVTGTRWGVLTPPVPLVFCTALAPLIAWLAMRWPIVAACLAAIPILFINPATGLALIELGIVLAAAGARASRPPAAARLEPRSPPGETPGGLRARTPALQWRTFAALAAIGGAAILLAQWNLGAATASFSFADAAEMIRYGQDNVMVYPFRGAIPGIGAMLAAHAVLTVAFLLLRRRMPLIVVQAVYALLFLRAGWLVLLPLAASLRKRGSDVALWLVLGISIAIGPLQQVALLAIWQRTHLGTALVFEGARFLQFSYLFLFALVALAIEELARAFTRFRLAVIVFLAAGAYLNLDTAPWHVSAGMVWIAAVSILWATFDRWRNWFDEALDRERTAAALVFGGGAALALALALDRLGVPSFRVPLAAGGCIAFLLFALAHSKRDYRGFVAACALAAVVGGPWMILLLREPVGDSTLLFTLKLPRSERNRTAIPPCEANTVALGGYIRAHLPPDAVFHVMTFDRSFRAYAGRAMLPVSDEWLIPIYDGAPVGRLRQESAALWEARNDLVRSKVLAKQFGANYLVSCDGRGRFGIVTLTSGPGSPPRP